MINNLQLPSGVFEKIARYCSVGERCKTQILTKLKQWNVPSNFNDVIIKMLEDGAFLNEDRYSELFIRSKVRQNHWGRHKIIQVMRAAKINEESIRFGFDQLDDKDYMEALCKVLEKTKVTTHDKNPISCKHKIIRHVQSKGFETDLILTLLKES